MLLHPHGHHGANLTCTHLPATRCQTHGIRLQSPVSYNTVDTTKFRGGLHKCDTLSLAPTTQCSGPVPCVHSEHTPYCKARSAQPCCIGTTAARSATPKTEVDVHQTSCDDTHLNRVTPFQKLIDPQTGWFPIDQVRPKNPQTSLVQRAPSNSRSARTGPNYLGCKT